MTSDTPPEGSNQEEITFKKILYILKTQKTLPPDVDPDVMYATMIARHIHKNFVLKSLLLGLVGEDEDPFSYATDEFRLMVEGQNRLRDELRKEIEKYESVYG